MAARLGIDASDVLFAEPDLCTRSIPIRGATDTGGPFAAAEQCVANPQETRGGKAAGPDRFAWHLEDDFAQLRSARGQVSFTEPRTRIAHVDTGYYRAHETVPEHIAHQLERSFVDDGHDPNSAEDPDNQVLLLDNSGHGTGTIGILAGGKVAAQGGEYLGGAPEAEILPLRVADSVVLLRTSALAQALDYAVQQRCDVLTLSMGGLPSRAWAEAVDHAYEQGVCICAAAGNHFGIAPPRTMVYPARYDRVVAVCGVMANGAPYADLDAVMEGSFGPDSAMATAVATYTPNIPWPRFGCPGTIRLNGEGTSAATPQVAAAAALWLEKYKTVLPRDWRRVEAVRNALFSSAAMKNDRKHFGNGVLRAAEALKVLPDLNRPQSEESTASFALLRLITGLGIDEPTPRESMFNLELAQRWLLNPDLAEAVPDPRTRETLEGPLLRRVMDAIIEDPGASLALRKHVAARYPVATGTSATPNQLNREVGPRRRPSRRRDSQYRAPRRTDGCGCTPPTPSLATRFDRPPSTRPRSGSAGRTSPRLGGSAGTLAMQRTQRRRADSGQGRVLQRRRRRSAGWTHDCNSTTRDSSPRTAGRRRREIRSSTSRWCTRWRSRPSRTSSGPRPARPVAPHRPDRTTTLSPAPHAPTARPAAGQRLLQPRGSGPAVRVLRRFSRRPGDHWPGTRVYSCLSHDIVAHETTHAILDGMYRRFNEPTNNDVLALHEGFADIVALMQHFTMPELLAHEIAQTRGDLAAESILGSLAVQFGQATGRGGRAPRSHRAEGGTASGSGTRPTPICTTRPRHRTAAARSWSPPSSMPTSPSTRPGRQT